MFGDYHLYKYISGELELLFSYTYFPKLSLNRVGQGLYLKLHLSKLHCVESREPCSTGSNGTGQNLLFKAI